MSKEKKTAIEVALRYLENRMRTTEEVRKKLVEKEFCESEIKETIDELIRLKYLDDYEYAKRYYEYNAEKKRGSFRAMRELEEKGVDKETVKFALDDFLFEFKIDEYQIAKQVADSVLDGAELDEKMRGKIARKLEARGFATGTIIKVLENNGR